MPRKVDQESLNAIGKLLYPYLAAKGYTYAKLAEKLQLHKEEGQQVIGRFLRVDLEQHKRFPQINLKNLVWALEMAKDDQNKLLILTTGLVLAPDAEQSPSSRLERVKSGTVQGSGNRLPASTSGFSELLAAVRAEEPHLIYLLHIGQAAYVLETARQRTIEIRDDPNFPPASKTEWLLRFGKLIEQAQEVAGEWHGERVMRSFRSIKQLFDDISHVHHVEESWSQHYYDEVILLARKAELWRELYRDTTPKSARYLWASDYNFDDALFRLDTVGLGNWSSWSSSQQKVLFFRDAILLLVVRCQQLHILAVRGDRRWEERIQEVERLCDDLSTSFPGLRHAIIVYFKSMGYKRLAWAYRPLDDSQRRNSDRSNFQKYCFDEAHRYMEQFQNSEDYLTAWRSANFYAFELPGIGTLPNAQRSLASDDQARLLWSISMYEGEVWRDPEATKRVIAMRLEPEIEKIYVSAQVKVRNTQTLAESIMMRS